MNKKQIVFLVSIIIIALLVIGVLVIKNKGNILSTDYIENEDKNTVLYGGKEYKYNTHLSNFLFVGIDTREPVDTYETREDAGQADTIFIVSLERKEKTIRCLAIPRDTIADVRMIAPDGTDLGTAKDHINIQYAFGNGKEQSCKLMKEAVSKLLYGLPIQGYFSMNMDGIPMAVEAIGGLELVVPDDSLELVNADFKEGATVAITAENAEQFVRYRDIGIAQSAVTRMNRQVVFLEAFAKKAKQKLEEESDFVAEMIESIDAYTVTNIGKEMFVKFSESSYNKEEVYTIPGEAVVGEDFDEYHVNEEQLYEMLLQLFYIEAQDD